ncbi:AGAP005927-PA [Anopheles gambiae str. PEST]|uniref:Ribosomal protein n=2 Tax=gambiae species complex TaxID=44542 RepID=Q7PNT5_ANOGA|nr:39S ribosomal protein L36, mitochondrial [Anopheles coluzzii]XP_315957.4 large ribosomal subunit protein bL36m [Anopheles gambiae]EAA11645.5 AGAP005927-PA [Anopheles gambiae str. PEST]
MWGAMFTRLRSACTATTVSFARSSELVARLGPTSHFHSLTQPAKPSPLTNQCSREALVNPGQLLLTPLPPLLNLVSGFKVKGRLKRRCKDCYFVMRQERLYVICKTHPRHKQMSMKKHDHNTWILTDATQGKARAW